jgi:hypothetical protein
VIDELQEQLLALERELDSQEGTVVTWEEGLTTFAHVLGEAPVRMSYDVTSLTKCAPLVPGLDGTTPLAE